MIPTVTKSQDQSNPSEKLPQHLNEILGLWFRYTAGGVSPERDGLSIILLVVPWRSQADRRGGQTLGLPLIDCLHGKWIVRQLLINQALKRTA